MILEKYIIKHERFLDVAFEVSEVITRQDEYTVRGRWINQGSAESFYIFPINQMDKIKIMKEDRAKWFKCVDPDADKCLRKCQWMKL